jgi:hypothetical protein
MANPSPTVEKPNLRQLTASLRNLRRSWPEKWPGLPLVFERAWRQLDWGLPRTASPAGRLLLFGLTVAEQVERDGALRQQQGQSEEEIKTYDDVLRRFGDASELALKELMAQGLHTGMRGDLKGTVHCRRRLDQHMQR